jgi:hypothetical protein
MQMPDVLLSSAMAMISLSSWTVYASPSAATPAPRRPARGFHLSRDGRLPALPRTMRASS